MEVFVQQVTAIAPAAFGDQDTGRDDGGGMELHGLHIAQRHDPSIQGDGHAGAFIDDGIGGNAVDAAVAAGGDDRGLGQVGAQGAVPQGEGHGAVTLLPVVD